jgi:hypothetical protein
MTPDRENQSAADRTAGWTDPAALCDAWRRRSLANGWLSTDDWDSEAANAVGAAACGDGGALTLACVRLGRSRAKAGIGIAETIGDLGALFEVLDGPGQPNSGPPLTLVCSVAEGWAAWWTKYPLTPPVPVLQCEGDRKTGTGGLHPDEARTG